MALGEVGAPSSSESAHYVDSARALRVFGVTPFARTDLMTPIQEGGAGRVPIGEGETANWVLTSKGTLRVANKYSVPYEIGIKHNQLALGEEIIYAGEMRRIGGVLEVDFASGTFSRYGLNSQFKMKEMNNRVNIESFLGNILHSEKKIRPVARIGHN